ncbi:MAG TPA: glutathione peroxidase [Alcanivoracaceae bacterium]|nr:glutathione peroxidase [Alcanivoracaceae bacterium]
MSTFYTMSAETIQGETLPMSEYEGKVVVVVNTASKCGFTPQYKGLQALYEEYGDQGLVVLGFPCNQFGQQEPENDAAIEEFCELNFGVTFPMFAKVEVNGDGAHPIFKWLKSEAPGILGSEGIKWNFTKFLINKKGEVVQRYAPKDKPEALKSQIQKLLAE